MTANDYDVIIKGGTLIDGTNTPRKFADVAIRDGRIARIGGLGNATATRIVDASGKIIAPGVVDVHTHYDAAIFWDPYCTPSGYHGMTTAVVSNCGFGFAPCKKEKAVQERYMGMMETTEQIPTAALREALPFSWESFPEWLDVVKGLGKGINVASYIPLNSLMIFVMGSVEDARDRLPTEVELAEMKRLLREALEAGAIGFAFSKLNEFNSHKDHGSPMPTDAADESTAYALAEVLREMDYGVIQALVDLPMAIDNNHIAERLAEISGRPVLQNIIVPFDHIPEEIDRVLNWLDACEAKGLDCYSQALAFRTWQESRLLDWNTWDILPAFAEFSELGDDIDARVAKASDPEWRARIKEVHTVDNMTSGGGMLDNLKLITMPDASDPRIGKRFGDIAEEAGIHVVDAFFDAVVDSRCEMDFRTLSSMSQDPALFEKLYKHPRVIAGTSDGGAHIRFFSGGNFSTDLILWLALEEKRFTLEELHHKFSMMPARLLNLVDRGALLPGFAADLMIYDPETLGYPDQYELVTDLPGGEFRRVIPAFGIDLIMVNGVVTFESGMKSTGATPGRVLVSAGVGENN
ncbi:amidohydrolase [Mycobacterium sp. shizuoka-1]|nr:amidohydrolase [Mycobacterium sp. shizuoka-1]